MKKIFWILVIVVIAVAAYIVFRSQPQEASAPTEDNAAAISSDLNSIDLGSIDEEFQAIDEELNNL